MNEPSTPHKHRLRAHFAFTKMPFLKRMRARQMYDSHSQRELLAGLGMWTEVGGIALLSGPAGVGKSITLRRFVQDLDERRFHLVSFTYLPSTVHGFLRSLSRALGLPMKLHGADLFDAAHAHLAAFQSTHGPHPLLLIDDAEGLTVGVLDTLRRLTAHELDAELPFSLLIAGTEELILRMHQPALESLRTRITYAHALRPFTLEDTQNYLRFHLTRAEADPALFTGDAVRVLFLNSQGKPRLLNQLALHALIAAAAQGRSDIDGRFMQKAIAAHPLYASARPDAAA